MTETSTRRCIACADTSMVEWFPSSAFPHLDNQFRVLRCKNCGLGQIDPMVSSDSIGDWYGEEYYGLENRRFHGLLEALIRSFRNHRTSLIRKHSKPGPALDIGCGRGLTLGRLRSFGYQPFGIELSDAAAWHARHQVGAEVHVGSVLDAPYPEEFFEVIILWHSLEHFEDPISVLERARHLLKPGGLIAIALPNFESLQARLTGASWFHLDLPRHYYHFSLRSLKQILHQHSFQPFRTSTFSLEMNPYGWLQSLYNCVGLPHNLLYSCIKDQSARSHVLSQFPIPLLATFFSLPLLAPVGLFLAGFEGLAGKGGSVEVLARKAA